MILSKSLAASMLPVSSYHLDCSHVLVRAPGCPATSAASPGLSWRSNTKNSVWWMQLHRGLLQCGQGSSAREEFGQSLFTSVAGKDPKVKVLGAGECGLVRAESHRAAGGRGPTLGRCHKTSISNPKLAASVSSSWVAELQPLAAVLELACTLPVLVTLWPYLGGNWLICTSFTWTRALL